MTADKITCRDTTWLLSDSRERALTDEELTALKRHIEECKLCQGASAQFEVLFRLYGPDKSFFDKKWVLPDIEKVSMP